MRIAYHYGSLSGGGVERRLIDLYRHLTRRGDDVWVVGLRYDPGGHEMLCERGGIPEDRILIAPPETRFDRTYHLWSRDALEMLEPDIIDVQWCATPYEYSFPAVATIHGLIPMPPAGLFRGILFIGEFIRQPCEGFTGPMVAVDNWVDLDTHPFHEELPEDGVCFLGREYKALNADAVARETTDTVINCYSDTWTAESHAENMVFCGYGDPREVFPEHRVAFASGIAALEAIAAGRLVIAGQPSPFRRGEYRLVTPERIEEMASSLFAFNGAVGEAGPTQAQRMAEFRLALSCGDCLTERKAMRAFVAEHHEAATQIALVREFYEEVLADG